MNKYKQRRDNASKRRNLVTYYHQDSKIAEQFRKIYMNIKFSSVDQANRTIIITSPGNKEGKSTTTINLGSSIAQLGDKVLIVDTDLRKPTMHATFKMDNTIGLSSVLQGKNTFEEAVNQTGIDTLDILTSGPPPINPAKLLSSQAMKVLIHNAFKPYDIVLFDTPPFLEVTDANILVSECDGIVLVMQSGKTKIEKISETKRLLELSGASVVGTILNER